MATRARIVEAAVDLHNTVGPAHTTDRAIAERAGVTRRTFYRHFPTDVDLFRACMADGVRRWPPPDLETWLRIRDPRKRLQKGLRELYRYYSEAGAGLAVVIRDAPLLRPELQRLPGRGDVLRAVPAALIEGWKVEGRRRVMLAAAIAHATALTTWQSLVGRQGLDEAEAISLVVAMVESAAEPTP